MRISNLRQDSTDASTRVIASIAFEDCDRPPLDVFYDVPASLADSLTLNPDAFLVGAFLPAVRNGERRLTIEGDVCPRLREGLDTALQWMAHWYGPQWGRLQFDTPLRRTPLATSPHRTTALFLSGGVDSLASLRANRLQVPCEHPASITDGILVKGFSAHDDVDFGPALAAGESVAQDVGIRLLPVATNIRLLDRDSGFWVAQLHGAALASVAHTLIGRVQAVHLASSFDIAHLMPWGSHPALDSHYGSYEVTIRHDGVQWSRLAKTALLAEWPSGLAHLRVCIGTPGPGRTNCGVCEKCVRTRVALLALGLDGRAAFAAGAVRPSDIANIRIRSEYAANCYGEVRDRLRRGGYDGHLRAVDAALDEYRRHVTTTGRRHWKAVVKQFDSDVLRGSLHRAYGWMRAARSG